MNILKKLKKPSELSKKSIAIIVAVAVLVSATVFYFVKRGNKAQVQLVTAQVTRGNIEYAIEGTGLIAAINQYEITSLAKGDIIADYFEEGDYVEKGQLLYEIDSSSAESNIDRAQSNYEKAQMSYEQSADDVANLNVKSDISGVITSLNVKKGDQVGNNSVVATVIDKDHLLLKIPFNESDARNLYIGQSATVNLENNSTPIYGTVSKVATGSVVNSYGVSVTNVEIDVINPGSILPGDRATVVAGEYACNDAGTFEYKNMSTITAKVSGKAIAVNYSEGDKISSNATIVVLESTNVINSNKNSNLSLKDAKSSLDDALETLEDYKITAPSSGKVLEKTAKAGEKLEQNSSGSMAVIADLSTLTFEMNIDELDIGKIEIGQEVIVTADSIQNKRFTGKVTSIKYKGTNTQGVTSYPVTVTLDNSEETGLIPDMNVTGRIVVESVENVLRVPVSAVRRGNLVIVKDDGKQPQSDASKIPENNGKQYKQNMPAGEMPQTPNGEMPQTPNGEMPQTPNGEMPQMPNGEMPQKPSGEMSEMPNGEFKRPDKNMMSSLTDLFVDTAYASEDEDKEKQRLENMKKQLEVPDGYTVVQVVTGLSDGTFIEIKSGLSEGQIVLLPNLTANAGNQNNKQSAFGAIHGGGGMSGGMSGGMPGGGMPSGGMPGGGMPSGGMSGGNRMQGGMR